MKLSIISTEVATSQLNENTFENYPNLFIGYGTLMEGFGNNLRFNIRKICDIRIWGYDMYTQKTHKSYPYLLPKEPNGLNPGADIKAQLLVTDNRSWKDIVRMEEGSGYKTTSYDLQKEYYNLYKSLEYWGYSYNPRLFVFNRADILQDKSRYIKLRHRSFYSLNTQINYRQQFCERSFKSKMIIDSV